MKTFDFHTASKHVLGDFYTPVATYLKLRDLYPMSALMESSDYHSREQGHSYIALCPIAHIAVAHGQTNILFPDGSRIQQSIDVDNGIQQHINSFLDQFKVTGPDSDLCGLYGYTSFNAVKYFENIKVKDQQHKLHDAPDIMYILYKYVLAFDHYTGSLTIVQMLQESEIDNIDQILQWINQPLAATTNFKAVGQTTSTLTDDQHRENIKKGIAHCLRGDVFQIVLSRRFIQHYEGDDFNLYRTLRNVNPSPYLFYFDFGGYRIFGSSPETHCRIEGRRVFIDPIAGTTKRTGVPKEDEKAAQYLRENPKENAEHVMLVDLARNDLSRNCNNVHVDFYKDMQYYSHVIHLVSRVSGQLEDNANPINAFIDTFPAGTLSGAPKVRAMQIITELEPHNRGAYGGCIGFIGLDGSLNQAITIRTFVSRDGELWFQAGGGIVAQSDVEYELAEVNNKLGALRHAINMAEGM